MRIKVLGRIFGFAAVSFGLTAALLGCGISGKNFSYAPPRLADDHTDRLTLNKSYDEVWKALIKVASSSPFTLRKSERGSGLITLTFASHDKEHHLLPFVDCGTIIRGDSTAPYLTGIKRLRYNSTVRLNGMMNLKVVEKGSNQSEVAVNAKYGLKLDYMERLKVSFMDVLDLISLEPPEPPEPEEIAKLDFGEYSWNFDSKSSDTVVFLRPMVKAGVSSSRTCRSSGGAEKAIFDSLRKALGIDLSQAISPGL